ncbi:hypothetical protein DLJ53_18900 [Acuticoccus sediminis]|uniref:DUF1236 domain-containing protein n=1 Tax=Acuticoccus sediminis TaxID=2184697 RepID=A0A8B2NVT5_9HYPH|nr:DUF1236 domain-containing protein [Acuticoccus sediminis]RAH99826.1 hypothetical protein DLJ53_18900 [Acuticoccus sediminis]
MKSSLKAAVAGVILMGGTAAAMAQNVVVAPQPDVVIAPEQQTVIRSYVKREPLASISLPGIELNLGSTVPQEVELHTIKESSVPYQYVVVNDRTVVVDPDTRQVIQVLN